MGRGPSWNGAPLPQRGQRVRRRPPLGLRRLFAEVLTGLAAAATAAAARGESIASIGIDTWAVDYGLVNVAGDLVAAPFSYRDDRSRAAVARVHQLLDPARLYATTGLQFLPFNTIYQLATETELDGCRRCSSRTSSGSC